MEKNNWLSNNKTLSTRVTVNARSSTNKKRKNTTGSGAEELHGGRGINFGFE